MVCLPALVQRTHDVFISSTWIWKSERGKTFFDTSHHKNETGMTWFESREVLQYFWKSSLWYQNTHSLLWFAERHKLYENKRCVFEAVSRQKAVYLTAAYFSCIFLRWNKQALFFCLLPCGLSEHLQWDTNVLRTAYIRQAGFQLKAFTVPNYYKLFPVLTIFHLTFWWLTGR